MRFYSLSGLAEKTCFNIRLKLRKAGATSRIKAVTPKEANFDLQEISWLPYLAGGVLSKTNIKKTEDGRYFNPES